MLKKLLRQTLAPLKRFINAPNYREWLRLSDKLKSFPPETEGAVDVAGFKIRFSDSAALLNMYENIFLNECYRFNPSGSHPVIIDCGANIGLSVLWLAEHYPGASVLAFEPESSLFRMLQQNITANNFQADLRSDAVWNQNTEVRFTTGKKQDAHISESGTATAKAIRLKDVLQTFTHIDLLKIDIEGAEYAVLNDCRDELHKVKNLFVECHFRDGNMTEALSILQLLQESGFRCRLQTPFEKTPLSSMKGFQTLDVFAARVYVQ